VRHASLSARLPRDAWWVRTAGSSIGASCRGTASAELTKWTLLHMLRVDRRYAASVLVVTW
jgi:hypothetical protein